jgi:hypothetical protein
MDTGRALFSQVMQVMDFVPWPSFDRLVAKYALIGPVLCAGGARSNTRLAQSLFYRSMPGLDLDLPRFSALQGELKPLRKCSFRGLPNIARHDSPSGSHAEPLMEQPRSSAR